MTEITEITEKQKYLNGALRHFKKVCGVLGLTYYLCNGTLLGAVKYGGFIPWDDDADVMMPREDYEKLLSSDAACSDGYTLLSKKSTPSWRYPYAKLSVDSTLVKEGNADLGCPYGLSLDVFPIDGWKGGKLCAGLNALYTSFLCRCLMASVSEDFTTKRRFVKKAALRLIWGFSRSVGHERLCKAIERQTGRKGKKYSGSVSWCPYGKRELIPNGEFLPQGRVVFEGEEYMTFGGFENYLRRVYGDYTLDLPDEKRHSNHNMKVWKKDGAE